MKRVVLAFVIFVWGITSFAQNISVREVVYKQQREGWRCLLGGGIGVSGYSGFSLSVEGELGKHISSQFYLGGGLSVRHCDGSSLGVFLSPRYYFSDSINSIYIDASLGFTLMNISDDDRQHEGVTTGIAMGYVFDRNLSIELGCDFYDMPRYIYVFAYEWVHLKFNYSFDLGDNLSKLIKKK